jgi:hypothetical protein
VEDAIYLKIQETIEDNYRDAEGRTPVSPSAVAGLATAATLAALTEHGLVVVDRSDQTGDLRTRAALVRVRNLAGAMLHEAYCAGHPNAEQWRAEYAALLDTPESSRDA